MTKGSKAAAVAWLVTAVYYFYQYTLRSAPAVMMPQLSDAFGLTAMGVASLVGLFYWGYSPFSLVAGVLIDRIGPRRVVPFGAAAVGVGRAAVRLRQRRRSRASAASSRGPAACSRSSVRSTSRPSTSRPRWRPR